MKNQFTKNPKQILGLVIVIIFAINIFSSILFSGNSNIGETAMNLFNIVPLLIFGSFVFTAINVVKKIAKNPKYLEELRKFSQNPKYNQKNSNSETNTLNTTKNNIPSNFTQTNRGIAKNSIPVGLPQGNNYLTNKNQSSDIFKIILFIVAIIALIAYLVFYLT